METWVWVELQIETATADANAVDDEAVDGEAHVLGVTDVSWGVDDEVVDGEADVPDVTDVGGVDDEKVNVQPFLRWICQRHQSLECWGCGIRSTKISERK